MVNGNDLSRRVRENDHVDLRGQTVEGPIDLNGAHISGTVDLTGATVNGGFSFGEARFEKPVIMNRCKILGDIYGKGALFASSLDMSWAICLGRVYFWRARFMGDAKFFQLQCGAGDSGLNSYVHPGEMNFSWAWFRGIADFGRCHMNGPVYFWRTRFFDRCSFDEASFGSDAVFMGATSEISLARDELPYGFFDRLKAADLLRCDPEETMIIDGHTMARYAQLKDVNTEQQLKLRMGKAGLSASEQEILLDEYRRQSGSMFMGSALLTRLRIAQRKSIKFIGVNASEWQLEGTDVDAISFFNAAQEPVPVPVGLGHVYYSVFISYGGPDQESARRLDSALTNAGVETYFFPEDAVPGSSIESVMLDGVKAHDRTLLICSGNSVGRHGWLFEAQHALKLEEQDNVSRLIPITLDEGLWQWEPQAPEHKTLKDRLLNARVAADFRGTAHNADTFNQALGRLLTSLKTQ